MHQRKVQVGLWTKTAAKQGFNWRRCTLYYDLYKSTRQQVMWNVGVRYHTAPSRCQERLLVKRLLYGLLTILRVFHRTNGWMVDGCTYMFVFSATRWRDQFSGSIWGRYETMARNKHELGVQVEAGMRDGCLFVWKRPRKSKQLRLMCHGSLKEGG